MYFLKNDSSKRYFDDIWKDSKPLAKLFRSASSNYLYDTGTNKILACRDEVFELLQLLLNRRTDDAIKTFTSKHGREKFLATAEEVIAGPITL